MSQITNSSPSLSWVNPPHPPNPPFPSHRYEVVSKTLAAPPCSLWSIEVPNTLTTLGAALSSCLLNGEIKWIFSKAVAHFEPRSFANSRQRGGPRYQYISVMERVACTDSGEPPPQAGASAAQPSHFQIENPMWLMSPLPFLIIFFGWEFNLKSDNNSAAKQERWNEFYPLIRHLVLEEHMTSPLNAKQYAVLIFALSFLFKFSWKALDAEGLLQPSVKALLIQLCQKSEQMNS